MYLTRLTAVYAERIRTSRTSRGDSNGNLTLDDLYKYKYDAENRMVELRYPNDALIASYAFDGNSLRVVKVWGADRTFYIYAGTQLISEFEDAASNTYNPGTTPGQAGSDSTSTMLYQHSDHLTTRLTTDNSGLLSNEQAHYPYGEQWFAGGTADPSVLRKFTSYQREDEAASGKLNYAVFREHSARVGRFLMADSPAGGDGNQPQSLNGYASFSGDPVNAFVPDDFAFGVPPVFGFCRTGPQVGILGIARVDPGLGGGLVPREMLCQPWLLGMLGFQSNSDEIIIKREGGYGDCKCDGLPVLAKIKCLISCVFTGPPLKGCNEIQRKWPPRTFNMCDRGDIFIREFECTGERSCCDRAKREFIDWCADYGRDPRNNL